ncbi:hypothetical protein SEVIR_9G093350v4 [Setaria viridis]
MMAGLLVVWLPLRSSLAVADAIFHCSMELAHPPKSKGLNKVILFGPVDDRSLRSVVVIDRRSYVPGFPWLPTFEPSDWSLLQRCHCTLDVSNPVPRLVSSNSNPGERRGCVTN